ncbi:MAG: CPBP family intramembrane metalloprotease [Planctomyces sp.]|nr:CPBP family intramembrane metalloprotease [Planctomyces sp.]
MNTPAPPDVDSGADPSSSLPPAAADSRLLVGSLVFSAVLLAVQLAAIRVVSGHQDRSQLLLGYLLAFASLAILTVVPPLLIRWKGQRIFDGPRAELDRELPIGFGAGVLTLIAAGAILLPFVGDEQDHGTFRDEALRFSGPSLMMAALFVAGCVWAPIFEEIAFRRLLFRTLASRIGGFLAAVASSGLFAVMHGYAPVRSIGVFVMGLAFCWVYARRKTLVAPMAMHATVNGIMLSLLLFQSMQTQRMPLLGVQQDPDVTDAFVVRKVTPGFPAADAGVQPGDQLAELAGSPVRSTQDTVRILMRHRIGDTVSGVILRDSERLDVEFVLTRMRSEADAAAPLSGDGPVDDE